MKVTILKNQKYESLEKYLYKNINYYNLNFRYPFYIKITNCR